MNIMFFLTPKFENVFVYDFNTINETLEKLKTCEHSAIPIITKDGRYAGTITEGDILWALIENNGSLEHAGKILISDVKKKAYNSPVYANANIEDLVSKALRQNFIPVIDDNKTFVGIIKRKAIIEYCFEKYKDFEDELDSDDFF